MKQMLSNMSQTSDFVILAAELYTADQRVAKNSIKVRCDAYGDSKSSSMEGSNEGCSRIKKYQFWEA